MKKQIKKLSLGKKTISNLKASELNTVAGVVIRGTWCGGYNSKN